MNPTHSGKFARHILGGTTVAAALLAATLPLRADSDSGQPRVVTVSGQAEVKAAPDEAELSAGVATQARSAADALARNNRAMNDAFAALKRLGIPDKAMQTSEFSVSPQYQNDRNGNATSKVIGYQVSDTVSVTVDDLSKLGPALDALVASGSNTLGNIEFGIRDPKPLMTQAREAAMKDAIDRAATYARAAGIALGPILSIGEGGDEMPRPMRAMSVAEAPAPTPVAAGEESIGANVNVTFAIR